MTTSTGIIVGNGRILSSTYEWKIDDYFLYSDLANGKCIRSPLFDNWYLKLYPNGEQEKGYISVFVYSNHDRSVDTKIQALFSFTLMNSKNEVITTHSTGKVQTFTVDNSGWGKRQLIKSLVKNDTNDKIKVVCEIIIKEADKCKSILMPSYNRMQHFESFKNFIKNGKLSDVKLTVQSKEIYAHKIVLAANSKVFAAMFEHNMRENQENKVVIEDVSYEVFSELLHFMYTGECTLNDDMTTGLFEAADKYQLLQLKEMCEEKFCQNISDKNVMTFLQLADMHSAERLKKEAIDFIALHGKEMIDKPEFESVNNLNPNLLKDVFRGIFANKN